MAEAGEVIAAVKGSVLALESIVELGEVLLGKPPVPPPDRGVSIFKSVGLAVQDLSAAGWVVKARQS
jgi:ornithine cyclodeaminase/alanine dehydrogenase-like protein (mu-crystallin family)